MQKVFRSIFILNMDCTYNPAGSPHSALDVSQAHAGTKPASSNGNHYRVVFPNHCGYIILLILQSLFVGRPTGSEYIVSDPLSIQSCLIYTQGSEPHFRFGNRLRAGKLSPKYRTDTTHIFFRTNPACCFQLHSGIPLSYLHYTNTGGILQLPYCQASSRNALLKPTCCCAV